MKVLRFLELWSIFKYDNISCIDGIKHKLSITVKASKYRFVLGTMHNCSDCYPFISPVISNYARKRHYILAQGAVAFRGSVMQTHSKMGSTSQKGSVYLFF